MAIHSTVAEGRRLSSWDEIRQQGERLSGGEEERGDTGAGPPGDPDQDDSGTDERLLHFILLLSDDDEASRWKAAEALGRMGNPKAVDELISTLWDDDARVRLKAAWALGRMGDPRAYAPLQRLYRMENEGAQEIIREALESIRRSVSRQ
jgi:hypothetical protein